MVPPLATNFLSSPDAQVEEQRIIQAEPEDTKTSGTATNIQDEISKSKIKGILRESTTRTGQHHIRVSPFAAWDAVSLRNSTVRPTSGSEHLHRASPFAATWLNKTYKQAKEFFEQLIDGDDIYTNVVGGTAKRARFESARHMREQREPTNAPKQRDNIEICANKRVQAYLDSFAEAASANEERIQEMKCAASSKDDQMAEMMARMDARDDATDE